jgi:hypothetical protein
MRRFFIGATVHLYSGMEHRTGVIELEQAKKVLFFKQRGAH